MAGGKHGVGGDAIMREWREGNMVSEAMQGTGESVKEDELNK